MPLDESGPFDPEPKTQADYVRAIWRLVTKEIIPRQDKSNGRLRMLEKWMWTLGGGLAVVVAMSVPLVLDLIRCGNVFCR
jgi:hypothetical protein